MKPSFLLLLLPLLCFACLPACVKAKGKDWSAMAFGTDAARFRAGPDGVDIQGMNQSASLGKVADVVKGMWSNTLTGMAFKFAAGKYYDAKGMELDAAKTVDLEKLRNAKSVADATASQTALETKLAAEAAAGAL